MNKRRLTTCSACSTARGLSLIEVVAALAILGTLLVGIVLAQSRHATQLAQARAQARAVSQTDALIAAWWASEDGVPIDAQGELDDDAYRWETRVVDNEEVAELGARVVRVAVYDTTGSRLLEREDGGPLVMVDLVVPDPEVERREEQEALEQEGLLEQGGDGDEA